VTAAQPPAITAVIVLYQRPPAKSEAFASLSDLISCDPALGAAFRIVLYDNSPFAQQLPNKSIPVEYVHDAANGGLVAAYHYALTQALRTGSEWLLLLDQDTTLTAEYVAEMFKVIHTQSDGSTIAAAVPILVDDRVVSPEADFFYHLRHQFPFRRLFPVSREASGVQAYPVNAYNSGAVLKVSALQKIGGFPSSFRLDYLDHALFCELQQHGYSIFVLPAVLQHKLAHRDLNQVSPARHTSVLQSQSLFVFRYGNRLDHLLYRLWLLRQSRHYRKLCRDPRVWKEMFWQALGKWAFPPETQAGR